MEKMYKEVINGFKLQMNVWNLCRIECENSGEDSIPDTMN
jgi:hypothetical protein